MKIILVLLSSVYRSSLVDTLLDTFFPPILSIVFLDDYDRKIVINVSEKPGRQFIRFGYELFMV